MNDNVQANKNTFTRTLNPFRGVKMSKHFFSENGHVPYQITCKQIFSSYTQPQPVGGVEGQIFFLLIAVMLHIKGTGRLVMHIPWSSIPYSLGLEGEGLVYLNPVRNSCIALTYHMSLFSIKNKNINTVYKIYDKWDDFN